MVVGHGNFILLYGIHEGYKRYSTVSTITLTLSFEGNQDSQCRCFSPNLSKSGEFVTIARKLLVVVVLLFRYYRSKIFVITFWVSTQLDVNVVPMGP